MTRFPWTILFCLSCLLILLATLLPGNQFDDIPGCFDIQGLDKGVHFLLFAVFAFLLQGFLHYRKKITKTSEVMVWVLVTGTIFGIFTEFLQLVLPIGRDSSLLDLLSDMAGTIAGFITGVILNRYQKTSPSKGSGQKVTFS